MLTKRQDKDTREGNRVLTEPNPPSNQTREEVVEQSLPTTIESLIIPVRGDNLFEVRRSPGSDFHRREDTMQQASVLAPTPSLDLTDTSSTDEDFSNHAITTPETPVSSPVSMTQYEEDLNWESDRNELLEPRPTRKLRGSELTQHRSQPQLSLNLLSLWPKYPEIITLSTCRTITEAAEFIAAVGIFGDAFNLFHLGYRSWRNHLTREMDMDILRPMTAAAINCARTCLANRTQHDPRRMLVQQVLSEVLDELTKRSLGISLDCVLLHFYLSRICKGLKNPATGKSKDHQDAGLQMIFGLWGKPFRIIPADIQDREHYFMTIAVTTLLTTKPLDIVCSYLGLPGFSHWLYRHSVQISHLERFTERVRDWLQSCQVYITNNSGQLDIAVGSLLGADGIETRELAGWLFYCFLAPEFLSKTQPCDWNFEQYPNSSDEFQLNCVLALAIIASSFSTLLNRVPAQITITGMWTRTIDLLLASSSAYREIAEGYKFRLQNLSTENPRVLPMGLTTSPLMASMLKHHLRKMIDAQQSQLPLQPTELLRETCEFYRSLQGRPSSSPSPLPAAAPPPRLGLPPPPSPRPELSANKSSPPSVVISLRSSVNSIRSSMSFDVKQMVELKLRLRRRFSQASARSKDSWFSIRSSLQSREEDSFENVTGMPKTELPVSLWEPRDTLMSERIEEEDGDVDMDDYDPGRSAVPEIPHS